MGQINGTMISNYVIVCNKSSHNLTIFGSTDLISHTTNIILIPNSSAIIMKKAVIIIDDNGNEIFVCSS